MKKKYFILFFNVIMCINIYAKKYKIVISTDIKIEDSQYKIQEEISNKLFYFINRDSLFSVNLIHKPTKFNIFDKLDFIEYFGSDIIIVISSYHDISDIEGRTSCFVFGQGDYGDHIIKNSFFNIKNKNDSVLLSRFIHYYLKKNGRKVNNDINMGNFALLNTSSMGILVNVANFKNINDISFVESFSGQEILVNSIYQGLTKYIKIHKM